ncbi:MAG: hypothetical protein RL223_2116 [Pseudomonadota bacterium]
MAVPRLRSGSTQVTDRDPCAGRLHAFGQGDGDFPRPGGWRCGSPIGTSIGRAGGWLRTALAAATLGATVALAGGGPAQAALLVDARPGGWNDVCVACGSTGTTWGYALHTDRALTLTALGAWDSDSDGLGRAVEVGLWDAAGTLLASVGVDDASAWRAASAEAGGSWLLASIAALWLAPGDYRLGQVVTDQGPTWLLPAGVSTADGVQLTQSLTQWSGASGLGLPEDPSAQLVLGPTAWAVPAPDGLALAGLALVLLWGGRLHRRRRVRAVPVGSGGACRPVDGEHRSDRAPGLTPGPRSLPDLGLALGLCLGLGLGLSAGTARAACPGQTVPATEFVRFSSPDLASTPPALLTIQGKLSWPGSTDGVSRCAGTRKLPAVLILHGSSGVDSRGDYYQQALNAAGFVTLQIDMWEARGVGGLVSRPAAPILTYPDAFSALALLAARPEVDAQRIGVIGFSWGGVVSLGTSEATYAAMFGGGRRFAAHVAHYPVCYGANNTGIPAFQPNVRTGTQYRVPTGAPVLIQIGTLDDYDNGVAHCQNLAAQINAAYGPLMQVQTHAGAYHGWDRLMIPVDVPDPYGNEGSYLKGLSGMPMVRIRPDPAAAAAARVRAVAFLKDTLR